VAISTSAVQRLAQDVQHTFAAVRQRHFDGLDARMAAFEAAGDGAADLLGVERVLEGIAGDQDVHGKKTFLFARIARPRRSDKGVESATCGRVAQPRVFATAKGCCRAARDNALKSNTIPKTAGVDGRTRRAIWARPQALRPEFAAAYITASAATDRESSTVGHGGETPCLQG
jgi:hypothetical protein